jgi:hypothetical protein
LLTAFPGGSGRINHPVLNAAFDHQHSHIFNAAVYSGARTWVINGPGVIPGKNCTSGTAKNHFEIAAPVAFANYWPADSSSTRAGVFIIFLSPFLIICNVLTADF